jgi:putative membrane protein
MALFPELSMRIPILMLVLACASLGALAASSSTLSGSDRKFIEKTAQAGMAEVDAGKLAETRADGQEVKDFARRMVEDHARANEELKQLAASKGAGMPNDVDRKHHRIMDKLQHHTAAQFEREYLRNQVSDHKDVVRAFEKEAKGGGDADLRNWAAGKLPTLREHLRMAEDAQRGLKAEKPKASGQPGKDPSGSMKR